MFGEIEISVNAAHPNLPLAPLSTFVGSPSTVRILGVPCAAGKSRITGVSLVVVCPDNSIRSSACVFAGDVWTGSLAAFDESAKIVNGFRVVANGTDENGNAIDGYVLGVGDVEIMAIDGTITTGKTSYYLHFLADVPENPKYADVAPFSDGLKMWDGTQWTPFAIGTDSSEVDALATRIDEAGSVEVPKASINSLKTCVESILKALKGA